MKKVSSRRVSWAVVLVSVLLTAGVFLFFFPQNYPAYTLRIEEKLTAYLDEVTLPMKLAMLSMQEPDKELLMPVYGKSVSTVSDTWEAPRDGVRLHEGQDIFAERGTPVFSATKGYVRRIRENSELGGNNVLITGAGGRRYYYAHLDRFAEGLRVGQEVTTDTVIGFVGNTGNAITTPPHLHFGMYVRRDALNPFALLRDR